MVLLALVLTGMFFKPVILFLFIYYKCFNILFKLLSNTAARFHFHMPRDGNEHLATGSYFHSKYIAKL